MPSALPTELGQPGVKGVLGKGHSEQCFGKGICQKKATLTSRQAQRAGTEKADGGTASVCGKGTEKNQMAARLTSGCGAPLWRISAAHGWKRGPAVDKEKPISKRSSPVSLHRSGGQVQALAL